MAKKSSKNCEVCNGIKVNGCRCGRYSGPNVSSGSYWFLPRAAGKKTMATTMGASNNGHYHIGDHIFCNDAAGYTGNAWVVEVNRQGLPALVELDTKHIGWARDARVRRSWSNQSTNTYWDVDGSSTRNFSYNLQAPPPSGSGGSGGVLTTQAAKNLMVSLMQHTQQQNMPPIYNGSFQGFSVVGSGVINNSPSVETPKHTFKAGDRVIVADSEFGGEEDLANKKGTIIVVDEPHTNSIGVSFDNWEGGHNLEGKVTKNSGYFGDASSLTLYVKPKIVLDESKLQPLILREDVKKEIMAVLRQHNHADKLFDEWGLGETIEYGRGMTMMFWGGPGTGKTFGAHCIAKALGTTLLVISAAEINSQEPGAANRNIQEAFATAKEKNQVLFLDECDSLITNRADLGMILASEVNTLLTEIEKFEGVCILATNRIETMDEALERRLALIVEFPFPKYTQRVEIWRMILPKKLPLEDGITCEILAQDKLTGGQIKNVLLQASRLALSEGQEVVTMDNFKRALARLKASKNLMGSVARSRTGRPSDGMSMGTHDHMDVERTTSIDTFLDIDEDVDKDKTK